MVGGKNEPVTASPALGAHSIDELLASARALVGTTMAEIADGLGLPVPIGRVRTKGWAGTILERELGVRGSHAGPDFPDLGVELKTVPVDARLVPRESTAVGQIDPIAIVNETWSESTVRRKLHRVLFVALEVRNRPAIGARVSSVGDARVRAVMLWSPSPEEDAVLKNDFDTIVQQFFRSGRATLITGHSGVALQVRPKGRNAADTRRALDESGAAIQIGRCGFYLRAGFVGRILRSGTLASTLA